MKNNQLIGKLGEEIASSYLESKGYIILKRNYHTPLAEIDIIAKHDDCIVIVEVKTRKNYNYMPAHVAVDRNKQKKIIMLTNYFIDEYDLMDYNIRFDVVECYWENKHIIHIENAFGV